MKVLVLGGYGIQGKAALFDLSKREWVSTIVVADLFTDRIRDLTYVDQAKTRLEKMDLNDQEALVSLMSK
ncbi:MAG: saccharopine dehydrogenase, partial [Gammaproteobacteria bacterium]|nr:saccharopine dehydrogenase [Gammaproteobacteria bacterium]NIT06103.1 saccharopine dehydrogenase [Gammaproteobacteria bacterium]